MIYRSIRRRVAPWLVKAFALILSQVALHAGPDKGAGHSAFPAVQAPGVTRGAQALQALGAHLPDVARAYGLQQDELQSLLLEDETLALDVRGRLHFTDPTPQAGALAADATAPQAALAPLTETFKLHSRSGAKRILFLDFDGHLISGTGWNTSYNGGRDIVAPPWDIDGSPSTFNDTERTRIQQIWQRIAEDYAPFDVDVTTELSSESQITRSSTSDEYYGTRVLISAISRYFGNYGGIAYVGAFDDVGDQYKPALVFPENLGPNGEKYIAEAASHEAGHNLGLSHDGTSTAGYYEGQGTGVTGWAPIMGAGYYENLTQWSKGEYAGANNKQDDLAVMQTYGLPVRIDDHGNTAATASQLPAGTQLSASGVIERSTDVDVFVFTTGAGAISITLFGSELGPNLDILAELRDANGALLAASNPGDQVYALLDYSVAAGTYYLHVRGTGLGDPLTTGYTSYGSLGQYWISGTIVDAGGNQAPVANANATPTSGTAPLVVQFDGSASFDTDGSVASYAWNFGDGGTASGALVSHTYAAAGTYTAKLTVTDNSGAIATTNIIVTVNQGPDVAMRVQSIALAEVRRPSGSTVRATVNVTDLNGSAIAGVTVNGSFGGLVNSTDTATTDANGNAVLTSARSKKSGAVNFTVTNLAKSGYSYNAAANLQNSATIQLAP
jgi:PKD repeat protein